jgi:hypothetical protein
VRSSEVRRGQLPFRGTASGAGEAKGGPEEGKGTESAAEKPQVRKEGTRNRNSRSEVPSASFGGPSSAVQGPKAFGQW